MGRPTKTLTDAQRAEVETLAAVLNSEQIADYFGIGRRTFFSLMEREPEIAALYKKGKARAIGAVAQGLIQQARSGNLTAMIFFLKTQAGWRERSEIEHHLPPETVEVVSHGRARLMEMVEGIAARQASTLIEGEAVAAPAAREPEP